LKLASAWTGLLVSVYINGVDSANPTLM
jgi:hypothetical protein